MIENIWLCKYDEFKKQAEKKFKELVYEILNKLQYEEIIGDNSYYSRFKSPV